MKNNEVSILGQAFISCSLRSLDRTFVELVEKIVFAQNFQPFGTVGLYDASPANPAELMRVNIPRADIIVLVATKRYFLEDVHTGKSDTGISEMLHVESGMAYALNKPIIVFIQKGASVGNFLPNVTQYFELDGTQEDLNAKWELICSLFRNAADLVRLAKEQRNSKEMQGLVGTGFAVFGAIKLLEYLVDDETKPVPRKRKRIPLKKRVNNKYTKIKSNNFQKEKRRKGNSKTQNYASMPYE